MSNLFSKRKLYSYPKNITSITWLMEYFASLDQEFHTTDKIPECFHGKQFNEMQNMINRFQKKIHKSRKY